jgi:ATP-binding cassette subfamily C (CFTR/MRP) protein 1
MPLNCPVSVQDNVGPIVDGCGSDFDFTLLFEEGVLFILPLGLASCLAILELARRCSRQALFKGGILLPLKLVRSPYTLLAFIALHMRD